METDLREQIYSSKEVLAKVLDRAEKSPDIIKENKDFLKAFVEEETNKGSSPARVNMLAQNLYTLCRMTQKPLKAFEKAEALHLIGRIEAHKTNRRKAAYSAWSKRMLKGTLRNILKNLGKDKEVYGWIKLPMPQNPLKKEDLLTPEEISRVVATAPDRMWQALIAFLAESGCRPGEILNLTIGDVQVNGTNIKAYVRGKMERKLGKRPIYAIKNYGLIKAWLAEHPQKNKPEAPLWISRRGSQCGQALSADGLRAELRAIAKRAGIKKRVFPYLLRHSFGTAVYSHYPTPLARKMMGHEQSSKMIDVYTHLNEDDVLLALEESAGVKERKEEQLNPELCPNPKCGFNNPYGNITCDKCHSALGTAGALKIEHEHSQAEQLGQRLLKLCSEKPELVENLISQIGKA